MALGPCTECGISISDKAYACPQCGAPRVEPSAQPIYSPVKRLGKPLVILICLLAVGFIGGAFLSENGNTHPSFLRVANAFFSHVSPTKIKSHNYAVVENYEYGYELAITDEDQKQGALAKPVIMVRNLGEKGKRGEFKTLQIKSGPFISIYDCSEPCEFAHGKTYLSNLLVKEERIRAAPGTVLALALDDIRNGQLVDSESDIR
jgi:hypothetical protein